MHRLLRVLIFLPVLAATVHLASAQQQDKEQSKLYMEQAELVMADTKAMDDARDIMVTAADFDTTNIKANFEAGHMHLETINKDNAIKYFMRIYRQNPNYRFDLAYWIGKAYHYGLDFENATKYYTQYRDKLKAQPAYAGKDKVDMAEVERNIEECQIGKDLVAHPKNYSIINVGPEINSEFEDYAPVLREDESEMVFTTRRREGNTNQDVYSDNKPYEEIFIAKKVGGKWTKAKNIGQTVNIKFSDSGLALSSDGKTLFLYRDEGAGDIYVSKRLKDGSWGVPEPLPGSINSSFKESSISITKDGSKLYFASERPGGSGGSDIYVCTKDAKGNWSRAKNLGPTINTPFDEDGPFIDYDSKTLYFSSKGGKGMGFFDIYKSTLIDAEKNDWTAPENLGYPINTPDNDNFYVHSPDGKRAYYSSVRDDGYGYDDIYEITIKEPEPVKHDSVVAKRDSVVTKPDSVITKNDPVKIPVIIKNDPTTPATSFTYVVTVIDGATKAPLEGSISLQSTVDKTMIGIVNKGQGVYEFTITTKGTKSYKLSVDVQGYAFIAETLKITGEPGKTGPIAKTVSMRKLVVGVSSVLRNIYFDFGKATFKKESYAELNTLEGMMKQNSAIKVEISGHTDDVGSKPFNKRLSELRANAVRSFLTSKGVDPRRVTAVGYGEEKPLASNDDEEEGRELNRRVEFVVTGD